jgi:hypothetical protein
MTDGELGKAIWDAATTNHLFSWAPLGAAARELLAPPIARMSVEDFKGMIHNERDQSTNAGTFVYSLAEKLHQLAQPAWVDADARAKQLNWERCQCFGAQPPGPDAAWDHCNEAEKSFWRKQAAKEAGDA